MLDFIITQFETLPSTNDALKEHVTKEEGYCIQALEQTNGKGRHGRIWTSPKGNLYLSFLLKPETVDVGHIALLLGLSIAQSADDQAQVKWPNDVLIKDKKLAGVLIEMVESVLICGLGVNVKIAEEDKAKLGDDVKLEKYRDQLLFCVAQNYEIYTQEGFEPIRQAWLEKAWNLGKTITVKQQEKDISGLFKDIDLQGRLILELENGKTVAIQTGDVFL